MSWISTAVSIALGHLAYIFIDTNYPTVPVNPGGKHELYGYGEITGNKVGQTGAKGPAGSVLIHNADSFAYLACGKSEAHLFRIFKMDFCMWHTGLPGPIAVIVVLMLTAS